MNAEHSPSLAAIGELIYARPDWQRAMAHDLGVDHGTVQYQLRHGLSNRHGFVDALEKLIRDKTMELNARASRLATLEWPDES